jgi:molybdopterin converting factor small subunit
LKRSYQQLRLREHDDSKKRPYIRNRVNNVKEMSNMPVTIEIPTAFRRFTDGAPKVDCSANTIAEALTELTARFPELSRHVRDDSGQIRQFLNIYLNEEDIRFLGGESCCVKEGDRVLLVPSIAGGSRDQV